MKVEGIKLISFDDFKPLESNSCTVKELKEYLNNLDERYDDMIISMSSDAEGNKYNTLNSIELGIYDKEYEDFNYCEDNENPNSLCLYP